MKIAKAKLPRPRLHTRRLSLAGKSSYGGNVQKIPTFAPGGSDLSAGGGGGPSAPGAAFPMSPMAFGGGGQ